MSLFLKSHLLVILALSFIFTACDKKKDQTAVPDPKVKEQSLNQQLIQTTWCTLLCDPQAQQCDNEVDHITALFFNDDGSLQLQKHPKINGQIQQQASEVTVGTWALANTELSITLGGELEKGPIKIEEDKIGEKRLFLLSHNDPKETEGELKECSAPKFTPKGQEKAAPKAGDADPDAAPVKPETKTETNGDGLSQ